MYSSNINESMKGQTTIRLPYVPWNEGPIVLETLENREGLLHSMSNIGCGFPVEWEYSDFKPLQDLSTALRYLAAYTVLVYNHCQGIATNNQGALADKRNSVQHRLLSLPAYPYEQNSDTPYQLYDSTRLAAQMYSLLCVYPCHPRTAPFEQLAIKLRKELSHLNQGNISFEESQLLLWILVMGAIMTVGTKGRSWFIAALNPLSHRLRLNSWDDMKLILTTFLWLDMTNDIDGRDIWDDVNLLQYRYDGAAWSSSSPSAGSSYNMTIRTQSSSPSETAEIPAAVHTFSTPW